MAIAFGAGLLCSPAEGGQKSKKEMPKEPLDLNTATKEELQKLPEVGPVTAEAIIRFREKSGPFRRVEDLLAVRGITKRRLEKIRPFVTVSALKREKPRTPK
ncbi:MAG TPA: helix-hairpin-helix domain-containing protein [Candidatus Acidoferrales bacterium]